MWKRHCAVSTWWLTILRSFKPTEVIAQSKLFHSKAACVPIAAKDTSQEAVPCLNRNILRAIPPRLIASDAIHCCSADIQMKLSVVMPVYNERATLQTVVERVLVVPLEIELVCVNDGSQDGSREIPA